MVRMENAGAYGYSESCFIKLLLYLEFIFPLGETIYPI